MIGPKLDARSYMNLILVVIAVLLALNLVAQPPEPKSVYTDEAMATQQVAEAVNQVARSNSQIAAALNRVADSIRDAGDQISQSLKLGGGAPSSSAAAMPAPAAVSQPSEPARKAPEYEGKIEILK